MGIAVKFERAHLDQILEQETMAFLRPHMKEAHIQKMVESPYSYSWIVNDRAVGCGGVIEFWDDRGEAWAVLESGLKTEFLSIHRAVSRFFEMCPLNRIEATVLHSFKEGHRWMKALGFEVEAPLLKSYFPNGADATLYAKVRK